MCPLYRVYPRVSGIAKVPEDLDIITVPAGDYVEFIHEAAVSDLFMTCNHIFRSWFPGSGLLWRMDLWLRFMLKTSEATNQIPGSGSWFQLKVDLRTGEWLTERISYRTRLSCPTENSETSSPEFRIHIQMDVIPMRRKVERKI